MNDTIIINRKAYTAKDIQRLEDTIKKLAEERDGYRWNARREEAINNGNEQIVQQAVAVRDALSNLLDGEFKRDYD